METQIGGPYIFISYAHLDSDRVLPILFALQSQGFRLWYDAGIEAGTEWPEYIAEALYGCSTFLLFLSQNTADSQNCCREISFSAQLRKKMVIVALEKVTLPANLQPLLDGKPILTYYQRDNESLLLDFLSQQPEVIACWGRENAQIAKECQINKTPEDYYYTGVDLSKEGRYKDAAMHFEKAAEEGHAEAQYQLADCYYWGRGVAKDYYTAAQWYWAAAEQNHALAQNCLGNFYYNGNGVPQSCSEAVSWYKKAAEQGYHEAQYNLAACYKDGDGVPVNHKEAVYWYIKAAEQGDSYAINALNTWYEREYDRYKRRNQARGSIRKLLGWKNR